MQAEEFPLEIDMVTFCAGAVSCAVESRFVTRLRRNETSEGSVSAGNFFGLPGKEGIGDGAAPGSCLELRLEGRTAVTVDVDEPIVLRTFSSKAIHPLPPLVAARCAIRGLRALGVDRESLFLLLDPLVAAESAI